MLIIINYPKKVILTSACLGDQSKGQDIVGLQLPIGLISDAIRFGFSEIKE